MLQAKNSAILPATLATLVILAILATLFTLATLATLATLDLATLDLATLATLATLVTLATLATLVILEELGYFLYKQASSKFIIIIVNSIIGPIITNLRVTRDLLTIVALDPLDLLD
jgi:hypothetical protein